MPLPSLPEVKEIEARLLRIFPEGTRQRAYCTREMTAKTIFVMLYIGAVEGAGWLSPKQVYRMSVTQHNLRSPAERSTYTEATRKKRFIPFADRWYADNTREPIRDETLKNGLVPNGAVVVRSGIPTTADVPRYALKADFAALFDPELQDKALETAIAAWQTTYLSPAALARIQIMRQGAVAQADKVTVELPNGERRTMGAGPSSVITKAVIEKFATRFLSIPAVIWISESGNKVVQQDDSLASSIRLHIQPDRVLPDVILADLDEPLLLIFIEVVATDGPIDAARREALLEIVSEGKFITDHILFVTAFQDRSGPAFRKAISELAWGSFAWCVSEPNHLIAMDGIFSTGVKTIRAFLRNPSNSGI